MLASSLGEFFDAGIEMDLHMVLLLSSPLPLARPVFATAVAFRSELILMELADNPLHVCDTVIADGLGTRLVVPQQPVRDILWGVNLRLKALSSGMKRVALKTLSSGRSPPLGFERWREAPPVAEVQDEREIALAGMLTRSAPPPAAASGAAPGGGGPASGG